MRNSNHWSTPSAPCRLEWRPSRYLVVGLVLLGVAASAGLLACEMPRWLAVPTGVLAPLYGCWLATVESGKRSHQLVWPVEGQPMLDGQPLDGASLQWRGPLAFLGWRDPSGRHRSLAWWPDTLPSAARRELRLAMASASGAPPVGSMAP